MTLADRIGKPVLGTHWLRAPRRAVLAGVRCSPDDPLVALMAHASLRQRRSEATRIAARIAARKPVTGWLCLSCRTETDGNCAHAIPCCPDQFAVRFAFLPPARKEEPCRSPDA